MKLRKFSAIAIAVTTLSNSALALSDEGAHWVCESEELYRQLLSSRLYGVGKEPELGCRTLPTGIQITEDFCETKDLKLCRYSWTEDSENLLMWGSAIISTLDK
jgi:hypothetical protein